MNDQSTPPPSFMRRTCRAVAKWFGSDLCGAGTPAQPQAPPPVDEPAPAALPAPPLAASAEQTAHSVAASWPAIQFSRGSDTPSLVVTPSLLTRGGLETLCSTVADRLVDRGETSRFRSTDSSGAIDTLVGSLMGLRGSEAAIPRQILREHFDAAVQAGESPRDALESTFVLACLSPYIAGA